MLTVFFGTPSYLSGSKAYLATGEFGFETTTLDLEGNVTKTGPFDHITVESLRDATQSFLGKTMQIPPIFSAIRKNGKKLYQSAREGVSVDDIEIEARQVEVFRMGLMKSSTNDDEFPKKFNLDIECGAGTYVRALIRDIGYKLGTVATMTSLERTKQGQFTLEDCLHKLVWSADTIYAEIEKQNKIR